MRARPARNRADTRRFRAAQAMRAQTAEHPPERQRAATIFRARPTRNRAGTRRFRAAQAMRAQTAEYPPERQRATGLRRRRLRPARPAGPQIFRQQGTNSVVVRLQAANLCCFMPQTLCAFFRKKSGPAGSVHVLSPEKVPKRSRTHRPRGSSLPAR